MMRPRQAALCCTTTLVLISDLALANGLSIFPEGDKPGGLLFFLLTFAALLLALAVHELGHLLTCIAQGFRCMLFVVGPLGIKRVNESIKAYFNTDLGMMGGIAATVPVKQQNTNRIKFARMVIAGPIASLLFGVFSFILIKYTESGAARGFWLVSAACSLGLVLATTLPRKTGIYFTDRAQFQRLMSKGKSGATEEALLNLIAQPTIDGNAKNIKLEQAKVLQMDSEPFMRFWGFYYEDQFYKDHNVDNQAATERLLAGKDTMPKQIWKAL